MKLRVLTLILVLGLVPSLRAQTHAGKEHFDFTQAGKHLTVWTYVPAWASPSAPVVFVLHGIRRDAETYLDDWTQYAKDRGFVLIVPEFSMKDFPKDEGYIYGNTVDLDGKPVPRQQWSFSMIEPVFDAVKTRIGNTSPTYRIYGHSAGAQFVQRFVYFVPRARVARAVAANAGWYMLPDLSVGFPYGLKGTPVTSDDLVHALTVPLTILLGTADTNAKDKVLRHTPEAEAQGAYRFARGQYFMAYVRKVTEEGKLPCAWTEAEAPGVGHSDPGMAPFAVKQLFDSR